MSIAPVEKDIAEDEEIHSSSRKADRTIHDHETTGRRTQSDIQQFADDDDDPAPAGDLAMFADMGIPAMDMGLMLDDLDLYPDEQLSDIASKLGFGPRFDELAGLGN